MKRIAALFLILSLMFVCAPSLSAGETLWQKNETVAFSGGKRVVSAVYVDLKDKTLRMEAVPAKGQIGQTDDLKNIAALENTEEREALAAINGTFFNAYSDMQPWGTIQSKGEMLNIGNNGSLIGFTADNDVVVDSIYVSVLGSINGSWEYPNVWYAWGLNHKYDDPAASVVFTPAFGKTTGSHTKTSIVVDQGKVIKIVKGEAAIPPEGFTFMTNDEKMIKQFKIGDQAAYKLQFNKTDFTGGIKKGAEANWDHVRTAVGAGPTLVKNGNIIANGALEGFTESKINVNRGMRSFAGVTGDHVLIMGTVSNVTLKELAEIIKKLGVINGINLDGGASSGLYFKGKYVTQPGRKLSNALVVTRLKQPPVNVKLNGKDLFSKSDPFLSGGALMLPVSGICKTLDMDVVYNTAEKSVTCKKGDTSFKFTAGSSALIFNGVEQKMAAAAVEQYGRLFVPARNMIDAFGGTISFDAKLNTALITMDPVRSDELLSLAKQAEQKGAMENAIELYMRILKFEPENAGASLKLAKIHNTRKNYAEAVKYYKKYLERTPGDYGVYSEMGWSCYSMNDMPGAEEAFKHLTEVKPEEPSYWMALGAVYVNYSVKEYDRAQQCYEKALQLNPSSVQRQEITAKLAYIAGMRK